MGGGHAHVEVLRRCGRTGLDADVHLVSDRAFGVYSGMVPGWIEGRYPLEACTIDLAALARRAGAGFSVGSARALDLERRALRLDDGTVLGYDILSLNVGARSCPEPGEGPASVGARPIAELVEAFDADALLGASVVVVGGGAAGVELAATLAVGGRAEAVTLVEAADRLVATAPRGLSVFVRGALESRGVRVLTGRRVALTRAGEVTLDDGQRLPATRTLHATPPKAAAWLGATDLPTTEEGGFVRTDATLTVFGRDEVFAAGDCALPDPWPHLARSGVHAVRQGRVLARNLAAALEGAPRRAYRPRAHSLTLLNLGRGDAAGFWGPFWSAGEWVFRLKDAIDRRWTRGPA